MPYTLMKGLAWILLALALGITIGWLLRSVSAQRQLARARRRADADELERLRARVAELETAAGAPTLFGRRVAPDDLTAIEGLGPDVETLCQAIGIRTWQDLSTTEVSLLKTMLRDAGPHFADRDPSTWPEQARLLASGRWREFEALATREQLR